MAKLILIPNTLGSEAAIQSSFPENNATSIASLRVFAVEHIKDARRLLVKMGLKHLIDESQFYEIHKNREQDVYSKIIQEGLNGKDIGLISDAGCPGIADPGAELVNLAHQNGMKVQALVGPSSILLALISSGLNGQSFAFHGYLNREKGSRSSEIGKLESESRNKNQTQLFMETPYRNQALFEDLLKQLNAHTQLSIACDINLPKEWIQTRRIAEWKKAKTPNLNKRPAIFSILA